MDFKKSEYNECLDYYGGKFDPLEEALRWQRAACCQSGWDLGDAFSHWAYHHLESDMLGVGSESTGIHDRMRYLPFGIGFSPEAQGRMKQALKPVWDREVPLLTGDPAEIFKVRGVWVDDGHMMHDASLKHA
jgi:hypothetical protein